MSDGEVTVRFYDGGEVTIEGLGGKSYSHVLITDKQTTFSIKAHRLNVGYKFVELWSDGKVVYSESWE